MTLQELEKELKRKHYFSRKEVLDISAAAVCSYIDSVLNEEVSIEKSEEIRSTLFDSVMYVIDMTLEEKNKNKFLA